MCSIESVNIGGENHVVVMTVDVGEESHVCSIKSVNTREDSHVCINESVNVGRGELCVVLSQ